MMTPVRPLGDVPSADPRQPSHDELTDDNPG